jgi:hypothetical protein
MTLNLNKKKQQVYKKLAAQDRKQQKAESSLRFLLKSLFFDTVPMFRRFPRPDLNVRTFFLTKQEILEASSGAEISLVLCTFYVIDILNNR